MPSLVNWIDFNKYNKELLDDDYNAGQKFVAKFKQNSADGSQVSFVDINLQESSSTLKQGLAGADGRANFNAEVKLKATLNQNVHEATLTNAGVATYDFKATGHTHVQSFVNLIRNYLRQMD